MKKHLILLTTIISFVSIFASCSDKHENNPIPIEGTWTTTDRVFQTNYPELDKQFLGYFTNQKAVITREFTTDEIITLITYDSPAIPQVKTLCSYEKEGDSITITKKLPLPRPGETEFFTSSIHIDSKILTTRRNVTAEEIREILLDAGFGMISTIPDDMKGEYRMMEKR